MSPIGSKNHWWLTTNCFNQYPPVPGYSHHRVKPNYHLSLKAVVLRNTLSNSHSRIVAIAANSDTALSITHLLFSSLILLASSSQA